MGEVSLGVITSPIGLIGHFKCRLHSNPPSWKFAYVYLNGEKKKLELLSWPYSSRKEVCKCKLEGIENRAQVAEIIDKDVWLPREELPELAEGEVYFCDLIGSEVIHLGKTVGILTDVYDFGAGEVLKLDNQEYIHWVSVDSIKDNKIYLKDEVR